MVFVDLPKVFGTVNRDALWMVHKKLGIPGEMVNFFISFLQQMKAAVFDVSNDDRVMASGFFTPLFPSCFVMLLVILIQV